MDSTTQHGTSSRTQQNPALESLGAEPGPRGVAVVTGGSAGLGRAIVRALAAEGWDVGVLARGTDGLAGAVADVAHAGRRAVGVPTDVAVHEDVDRAADRVEQTLGPITLWVNNAMTGVFGQFVDVPPDDFERVTAVTYLGVVNGTRAALRHMGARDSGVIVQVGSALAFRGIPLQSAYCGAKHAMVGFTESVITELLHRKSGITVCMVHMPALNTVQFSWLKNLLPHHSQPVPPIYQPEVGAEAVARVALHPSRTTWVGYPTVGTILGNRVIAPLLDRYLARTGYDAQQTTTDTTPPLGVNLYEPVPGDHGAHGDFDGRSKDSSAQVWATLHKGVLAGAAAVAGAVVLAAASRRGS
ncbi:3-phenylpropionate-dihydrodiol/cinnamic acid-dihydrodiol dehydrogenase [Cellulomonas sp. T2.31MG-18]|uniref:SDR family oxidoreductase n=1 Tax=Cellulomonas sp. T2.31MG-18 TaxID=3157619 RepID=UPI0035E5A798